MTERLRLAHVIATAIVLSLSTIATATAQNVIATVNDDPITNVDIDQHAKLLRVLHKPASPQNALDDVILTRLKLIETGKFKISPSQAEIGWAIGFPARELKTDPQRLLAAIAQAGVTRDQVEQKFKADAAWLMYIRALNRTVEVSETDIRAELARRGGGKSTQYSIQQIIFVLPSGAGGPAIQERIKNANGLRARFTDCASGSEIARSLPDAVVQPAVNRASSGLPPQLKQLLDKTEVGHLTPPQRGAEGIVMHAVCSKSDREDSEAIETIRNDMLTKKLTEASEQRLAEVRSRAIIVRK